MVQRFKFLFSIYRKLLKQENGTYTPPNTINFFIVYEWDTWSRDLNSDFTLKGNLFGGGIKLAKNADLDKFVYSGYGIGFDLLHFVHFQILIGAKMLLFFKLKWAHQCILITRKKILILGKGPAQGLGKTTLTAEAEYSSIFWGSNIEFCLSLHFSGSNSILFGNATKIYQFKGKDSEIKKKCPLCLGSISGDFSANNMKKTESNGCVYNFSVDYRTFNISDITNIHKYLMKKHDMQ